MKTDTIFHNGATVNYLFNYDMMRDANVLGTNEILRLAFEGRAKEFNYVSTTFIFRLGGQVCSVRDRFQRGHGTARLRVQPDKMGSRTGGLRCATSRACPVRVFRPALVSPSVEGGGNNFDIAVRLVAFMVNHGIGVDTLNQVSFVPADIVANNIVAISTSPGTANQTFHVVRDEYSNMTDITSV